jgi:hypothetical protein
VRWRGEKTLGMDNGPAQLPWLLRFPVEVNLELVACGLCSRVLSRMAVGFITRSLWFWEIRNQLGQ